MPQNIAGNRAVFVDANGQALKGSFAKAGDVAVDIGLGPVGCDFGGGWAGHSLPDAAKFGVDCRFVLFGDFAARDIEFQPIAVCRDVACLLYTSRCV